MISMFEIAVLAANPDTARTPLRAADSIYAWVCAACVMKSWAGTHQDWTLTPDPVRNFAPDFCISCSRGWNPSWSAGVRHNHPLWYNNSGKSVL
jgi:hypothetical protein